MNESRPALYKLAALAGLLLAAMTLSGCIYRISIQQGNLIPEEQVDQVEIGMSRSAVEFLLGTPTISDPFHQGRWDYPYYLKVGRSDDIEQRWIAVWFENDVVARIERDLTLDPSS